MTLVSSAPAAAGGGMPPQKPGDDKNPNNAFDGWDPTKFTAPAKIRDKSSKKQVK